MPINPDEFTFREACHDDLDEFADLYCTLWTSSLRNRGDFDDAMLAGRYNISMQFNRSPITIVAESDGRPIALCCVGLFDGGGEAAHQQTLARDLRGPTRPGHEAARARRR